MGYVFGLGPKGECWVLSLDLTVRLTGRQSRPGRTQRTGRSINDEAHSGASHIDGVYLDRVDHVYKRLMYRYDGGLMYR